MDQIKCAVITGSTSGIGLGIAKSFADRGYAIMLNGIEKESEVAPLMDEIKKRSHNKVAYRQVDLSQPEGCRSLIHDSIKELGGVSVLVNNAGIQYTAEVPTFPEEKWHLIISLNLSSAFFTSQASLPHMYKQKWGRLIHVASAHGLVASVHKAPYVAAKHGVLGLSKVIALESAGTGVTSNCICPGWVKTPLVEKQIEDIAREKKISIEEATYDLLSAKQPSGQFATPEQIGELSCFLASDGGAQITGSSYTIDGGWTAQ